MGKKMKVILTLFLMAVIIFIPFENVSAHSVELDPNSLISFPIMIINGQGNITIKSSETGYSLYYQAVEMSDSVYEQIEQIRDNGKKELENNIKAEMDKLKNECDNLKTTYDEAYEAYKEKLDSGITGTELETAKTAYETAKTNYQKKVTEYKNKAKEYDDKVDEINEKIKELTPTYVEENWIKTEDGSFSIDRSQFFGEKAFVIWAKLISSDGTISYDEAIATASGTKVEDINVEGISLDKTEVELTIGSSYTLTVTLTPDNATDKLIIWTSDDEEIATVSDGKITAKASGTATITATTNDGSYTAICKVTVSEKADTQKDDTSTENKKDSDLNDTTTATGKLPQTGMSMIIIISIFAMMLIAVMFYKKYHNYRDIK